MSLAVDHLMANIVRNCKLSRLIRLKRIGEKEAESFQGGEILTGEDLVMRYAGGGGRSRCPSFWKERAGRDDL